MILVDPVRTYPTKLRHKEWSHMVSTVSADELHAFAARLGLKRAWFQSGSFDHYDITPSKRARALELGAREVSARALLYCNYDYARRRQVRPCVQCAEILVTGTTSGTFVDGCTRCDLSLYLPGGVT